MDVAPKINQITDGVIITCNIFIVDETLNSPNLLLKTILVSWDPGELLPDANNPSYYKIVHLGKVLLGFIIKNVYLKKEERT